MKRTLKSVTALLLCLLMLPIASIQKVSGLSEKEFEKSMNESVILYLNKSNVLLFGKKNYISDDREITPYKEGETVYLPVAFFAGSIGGSASDETDGNVTVSAGGKTAKIAVVKGKSGAAYARASELCTAFGYRLYVDRNGIVAYSKKDLTAVFDWTANLHLLRKKLSEFLFDDVSGEELYSLILKNNPDKTHPRLLITNEKMAAIRDSINNDGIYKALYNHIKKAADGFLKIKPSKYEIRDGIRLLYVSWEASDVIISCALAYHLTQNEKYAARAYEEMEAVCAFPDWNPKHYLDVGVMSAGVALGYDWLYNYMTPEQRATVRAGIEKHVIPTILEDINGCTGERTYQWNKDGNVNNWRCVCTGGVGVAMLAMIDEFEGDTLKQAKTILPAMLESVRPTMMLFAPYGAFEEGFGYWEFAMQNYCYFIKSLEMMTGSDFGYVDLPGLNLSSEYFVAANGPVQIFNYHNAGSKMESFYPPELLYLADKFDIPETTVPVLKRIRESNWGAYGKYDDILYYDPSMNKKFDVEPVYDYYFPVSEIATMRTGTAGTSTFVGLHCDRPFGNGGAGEEHMDAGQFQLQSKGQVWFLDLGSNDYNVSDLHNTYRFRAEGHNTVIFNPDYDFAMKERGNCYISEYKFSGDLSYAVGNMTDAYKDEEGVESFLRGVKLDKDKGYVTIQDEIRLKNENEMYWFAHTDATITLSEDKKSATLSKGGKKIYAYIANGEGAEFSVMRAEPLPTSPQVPDQEPVDRSVKKLTIHLEKCGDIDLCVVFATSEGYTNLKGYEFTSISTWKNQINDEDATSASTDTTEPETSTPDETNDGKANEKQSNVGLIAGLCAALAAVIAAIGVTLFKKKKNK